jgi:hypothetical protein
VWGREGTPWWETAEGDTAAASTGHLLGAADDVTVRDRMTTRGTCDITHMG